MAETEFWPVVLLIAICGVFIFHKALKQLLTLAFRTALGGLFLALIAPLSSWLGFGLGVNLFNALVLGLLGAPGFGLLLMLRWSLL